MIRNIDLIQVHSALTFYNGQTARSYFLWDNIYLSRLGTSSLPRTINQRVTIMTSRRGNMVDNEWPRRSYGYQSYRPSYGGDSSYKRFNGSNNTRRRTKHSDTLGDRHAYGRQQTRNFYKDILGNAINKYIVQ